MEQQYAVLTGDIVKSRKLTPEQLEAVRRRIEWCVSVIGGRWEGAVVGKADFFRGDGWQILLARPELALRAGLMLRTSLIAFEDADSRVAIGIGPVEQINEDRISKSMGRVFELSGQALDDLKTNQRFDLLADRPNDDSGRLLRAAVHLCDALVRRLSPRQAEAVFWAVQGYKHDQIAGKMEPPVDRSMVTKNLSVAGWVEMEVIMDSETVQYHIA